MKEFISIFEKDFRKEGFTMTQFVVSNVVFIVGMIGLFALCGWLESVLM